MPDRTELLPVSAAQSCAICGDGDWHCLYLLLNVPEWVQQRGWFGNWFIVLCDSCHEVWNQDDALLVRWELNDEHRESDVLPFEEYRRVVATMQSEPPLPRAISLAP